MGKVVLALLVHTNLMFVPVLSNPKVIAGEPGPLGKERLT